MLYLYILNIRHVCATCKSRGKTLPCMHSKIESGLDPEEPCPDNLRPYPENFTTEDYIRILSRSGLPDHTNERLINLSNQALSNEFENFKEVFFVQNHQPEHHESYVATCLIEQIDMMLRIRFDDDLRMLEGFNKFCAEKEIDIDNEEDTTDAKRAFLSYLLNYEDRKQKPRIMEKNIVKNPYLLIPCVLHLTSRTGEKLWKLLINECLLKIPHLTDIQKRDRVKQIEEYVAGRILNTGEIAASDIVIKVEKGKLQSFSIASNRLRKTINRMQELLDLVYVSPEDRSNDITGCPSYKSISDLFTLYDQMMSIFKIPINEVLNNDRIYEFQDSVDQFADHFLKIFEPSHITNYFHMLFAGHLSEMMIHHGNLNKYNQQGWEGLNGVYKQALYKLSNKGGAKGCGGAKGKVN